MELTGYSCRSAAFSFKSSPCSLATKGTRSMASPQRFSCSAASTPRALRKAGPFPLLGLPYKTSAYRIQVDVPNSLPVIFHGAQRIVKSLP
jgi:hypothetical protein